MLQRLVLLQVTSGEVQGSLTNTFLITGTAELPTELDGCLSFKWWMTNIQFILGSGSDAWLTDKLSN